MKKTIYSLILIITFFGAKAQKFMYTADIDNVDTSAYFHIFLPPAVTSKLNYKFSDIRIYDEKGTEVPYIRFSEDQLFKTAKARELKILVNQYKRTKKYTQVLVHNPQKYKINNLVLVIDNPKNAEVWINVAGSNDRKNWNVLKNNARYLPEYSDSAKAEVRIIELPETNYDYYRIFVFDYGRYVFNVHNVINYDIGQKNNEFVELPKPDFFQDDTSELNKSIINIKFDEPQYVDKLQFWIKSPSYYLRKAEITKKDTTSGKKIRLQLYDQNQEDFYLCSDSSNVLLLSRYYVQNMFLIVYNNDNQPLKFSDIRAYQRKEYIIAHLEKGKKYTVRFGNKNVAPPIYDLKFFKNKIPAKCPEISVSNIKKAVDEKNKKKNIYIDPVYLWIVFGIVIIILTLISIKVFLLNKKKTNDEQNN